MARERNPCALAFFTKGSAKCSCSQRPLLLERRATSKSPEPLQLHLATMELSENQRRFLRGRAHALKPIIQIGGKGLTDAVAKETARALHDHELIKVRAPGADREARDALFARPRARAPAAPSSTASGTSPCCTGPNAAKPGLIIPDPNGPEPTLKS